jgi:hypothetical protein
MPIPEPFEPDITKWEAWRPEDVTRLLAKVEAPWCVAAGWAIDLFLGYQRRPHGDLEIAVPQDRFGEVAGAFSEFELFIIDSGRARPLVHGSDELQTTHQTWVREPATGMWRLDIFREPSDGDTWICRRDPRIRLPYDRLISRTDDGIPYCRPEVELLFKAKAARPKDDDDFAAVLTRIGTESRRWLGEALAVVHPGHPWLADLG